MVQMISESKRKIAALALAGAMAIGGAAGVATTIASPAQNQSGIVMEAEAANIVTAGGEATCVVQKSYNIYGGFASDESNQYQMRLKGSYRYNNKFAPLTVSYKSDGKTVKETTTLSKDITVLTTSSKKNSKGEYYIKFKYTGSDHRKETIRVFFYDYSKYSKIAKDKRSAWLNNIKNYKYMDIELHLINNNNIVITNKKISKTASGLGWIDFYVEGGIGNPKIRIKSAIRTKDANGNPINKDLGKRYFVGSRTDHWLQAGTPEYSLTDEEGKRVGSTVHSLTSMNRGTWVFTFEVVALNDNNKTKTLEPQTITI